MRSSLKMRLTRGNKAPIFVTDFGDEEPLSAGGGAAQEVRFADISGGVGGEK
jgi:hypothetical protein